MKINWSTLTPIPTDGLKFMVAEKAAVLNKQMAELVAYRSSVDAEEAHVHGARPGGPVDEAMRREVTLRNRIKNFCERHKIEPGDHADHLKVAHQFLTDRGTHTTRHRGGF